MTPASSKSMLNADTSTPSVPNVVIGVTPSPSSIGEISSQLPSSVTKAEAAVQLELPVTPSSPPVAVAVSPVRDTLVAPAMPPETSEDDEDDPEPASEQRIRVAEKVDASVEEPKPEGNGKGNATVEVPNLHDTLIDAQKIEIVKPAEEPKHDDTLVDANAKRPKIEEPANAEAKPNFEKTLPFGSAEMFGAPKTEEPKIEEPKVEAKKEALKPLVQDEETIPPAGDLAVSVVAEQFFSESDLSRLASADDDLDSIVNEKAQRKSDPAVVKRRAKLAKYVTWAVGVSAALCLIAVVRTTFSSSSKTIAAANAASGKAKSEMAVKAPAQPIAPAPKAAEPAAAPIAAPVEPATPVVLGDIKVEKAKVKAALDKNKLADAIEAGERAVMIDETDSEAWLLLGAAYHQKGNLKEAQRAYHACKERGTKDKFQRECSLFAR